VACRQCGTSARRSSSPSAPHADRRSARRTSRGSSSRHSHWTGQPGKAGWQAPVGAVLMQPARRLVIGADLEAGAVSSHDLGEHPAGHPPKSRQPLHDLDQPTVIAGPHGAPPPVGRPSASHPSLAPQAGVVARHSSRVTAATGTPVRPRRFTSGSTPRRIADIPPTAQPRAHAASRTDSEPTGCDLVCSIHQCDSLLFGFRLAWNASLPRIK
jgi:hypothetical protein